MVTRSEWWILTRQSREPGTAADHEPRLRLRGNQRRGPGRRLLFAVELDAAYADGAQASQVVRPWHPPVPLPRKPQGPLVSARIRRRDDPLRLQPLARNSGGRARSLGLRRSPPG